MSNSNRKINSSTETNSENKLALYRKYRPASFKEVVGQEQVVSVLSESIKAGKISHAYLFIGTRGTGKTSVARIFAKELGVSNNDLYEIDAASNTSVEDIRELNEAVNTIPLESPYKVYILDEVHMMSKSAFNAFLKTLEEPPKHVIFILATTEVQKIPDTVISRCQVFNFKKPSREVLKKVVADIAKKEGAQIDGPSLELIALLGDGSFRDTLSTLQKVISYSSDNKITIDEVEKITGAPKSKLISDFISSILENDLNKSLSKIHEAMDQNIEVKIFTELVIVRLRYLLMVLAAPAVAGKYESDFLAEEVVNMKEELKKFDGDNLLNKIHFVQGVLVAFISAYQQVGRSSIPSLPIELALIKVLGQNVNAIKK